MRLILVRHGETAWNADGRHQGQTDVPLSAVGRRQAAALARRLASEEIDAIYASDLRRARETAAAVGASHRLPVRDEPRLREMCFGAWEGLTYDQIQERYPRARTAWEADPLGTSPPGGETLAELAGRVESALADIVRAHKDEDGDGTVLVVAHGGPLRVLLGLALGLSPQPHWRFRLDNASLSELYLYPEGAVLACLNDTGHLREGTAPGGSGGEHRGRLTLILGGARSGKSTFAQELAQERGEGDVLFVATAEAGDEEMRRRIEVHRRERPDSWRTLEAQRNVGRAILERAGEAGVILVDCLTLLISNLLMDVEDPFAAQVEARVMAEVQELVACVECLSGHLIVVSNEVGMGLVPTYPLGRAYRDLLGAANRALARQADEVYVLVAGIPTLIKT